MSDFKSILKSMDETIVNVLKESINTIPSANTLQNEYYDVRVKGTPVVNPLPSKQKQKLVRFFEILNQVPELKTPDGEVIDLREFEPRFEQDRIIISIESVSENKDLALYVASITEEFIEQGYKVTPLPEVVCKKDMVESSNIFGKTAIYDAANRKITLYTEGRHTKDILRSFAHEMVHHAQNIDGKLHNITTTNTNESTDLQKLEEEAYLVGNITFRKWEDRVKNAIIEEQKDNPCWKGYKMVGTKMKDGKEVPNCVPISEQVNEQSEVEHEGITYTMPNFEFEWEEAKRYGEFKNLSTDPIEAKKLWVDLAYKKGYTTNYSEIKKNLGNLDLAFKSLDKNKQQRFESAFSKGIIEMPIVVKFQENDYDLVAGNTRASGLISKDKDPVFWVVDIS